VRAAKWSRRQRWKNDVIFRSASAAMGLGLSLPRSWLPWLGTALGTAAHALLGEARRATLENLALVHPHLAPPERRAMARDVQLRILP